MCHSSGLKWRALSPTRTMAPRYDRKRHPEQGSHSELEDVFVGVEFGGDAA